MNRLKILLVILLVVVNLVPVYSLAESQPTPEPTLALQDTTSQSSEEVANTNPVTIYVFTVNVLGIKLGKRVFPVYINGLLISSLDYSKYIRYETTETKFKVATMHIEVSSSKEFLGTHFVGNPVYSEIIINDAKFGETYCFEIQNNSVMNNNRLKQITTEEAQKRLKTHKEQEY